MPKSHLLALILRLSVGFLVLAVLAFFLFSRLRRREPPTGIPTTETPVAIVTPTPQPSPTPALPEVEPREKAEEPPVTDKKTGAVPREPMPQRVTVPARPQQIVVKRRKLIIIESEEAWAHALSGSSSAWAWAGSSGAETHAVAE